MKKTDAMKQLESMGTAQNRKVYGRHGVTGKMFGVSYANLGKLKKSIKVNHDLARDLWETGNHDARVLATMVADAAKADAKLLEKWAGDLDNYVISDAFSKLVASGSHAKSKADKWIKSGKDHVAQAGWNVVSMLAGTDKDLPAAYFEDMIARIETTIGKAGNRTRHSMNQALISIGLRSAALEKKALAVAKRIGRVDVDHGETSCSTPDAAAYIRKTKAYRAAKKTKSKSAPARGSARA